MRRRITILGIPVDKISPEEAMERFVALMETEGCAQIVTPNSEIIWRACKDEDLRRLIIEADIAIPDGIGLVYASRIIKEPLNSRTTGIDFLSDIAKWLSHNDGSMFFLGATPGVAEKAAENMADAFPGLKIAGCHHGYFKEPEEAAVLAAINDSGADVLCVAMGSPKQEEFVRKYKDVLMVKAAIGVGGSLDVWAGSLKRAPVFFRDHGLEWLYRLIKEPHRIGRMAVLPLFILKVFFRGKRN